MGFQGTYTGHYEDVKALAELLDDFEARSGCSVPIHGKQPTADFHYSIQTSFRVYSGCSFRWIHCSIHPCMFSIFSSKLLLIQ